MSADAKGRHGMTHESPRKFRDISVTTTYCIIRLAAVYVTYGLDFIGTIATSNFVFYRLRTSRLQTM